MRECCVVFRQIYVCVEHWCFLLNADAQSLCAAGACSLSESWWLDQIPAPWQGTMTFSVFANVTHVQRSRSANDVAKSFGSISSWMGPPTVHARLNPMSSTWCQVSGFHLCFGRVSNPWRQVNHKFSIARTCKRFCRVGECILV